MLTPKPAVPGAPRPPNGLNRHQRIRKHAEYQRLQGPQGVGRRLTTPHLIVLYTESDRDVTRLGLTVSKRVGKAVVRTRVKRLLREAFRAVRGSITRPLDVVLIAKPAPEPLRYAQVLAELSALLPRLNATPYRPHDARRPPRS